MLHKRVGASSLGTTRCVGDTFTFRRSWGGERRGRWGGFAKDCIAAGEPSIEVALSKDEGDVVRAFDCSVGWHVGVEEGEKISGEEARAPVAC